MADVPMLVCTDGALAGQHFGVPEDGLDLGRSEENHVVIKDDGVSRFHARLLFDNGSLWLQDAGSRNGVFVNGVRVTGHQALKVGDTVAIAQHVFHVRWSTESGDGESSAIRSGTESDDADPPARRRWFWPFS